METIFINSENSKTSEQHRFKLDLTDKPNLKDPKKNMTLVNLSIYYTWKNIKSEDNNNKFKISPPTWNDTFGLPSGSYSISDIQDYFEFIIKNTELKLKIHLFKFMWTRLKTELFHNKNGLQIRTANPWNNEVIILGSTKKLWWR